MYKALHDFTTLPTDVIKMIGEYNMPTKEHYKRIYDNSVHQLNIINNEWVAVNYGKIIDAKLSDTGGSHVMLKAKLKDTYNVNDILARDTFIHWYDSIHDNKQLCLYQDIVVKDAYCEIKIRNGRERSSFITYYFVHGSLYDIIDEWDTKYDGIEYTIENIGGLMCRTVIGFRPL